MCQKSKIVTLTSSIGRTLWWAGCPACHTLCGWKHIMCFICFKGCRTQKKEREKLWLISSICVNCHIISDGRKKWLWKQANNSFAYRTPCHFHGFIVYKKGTTGCRSAGKVLDLLEWGKYCMSGTSSPIVFKLPQNVCESIWGKKKKYWKGKKYV